MKLIIHNIDQLSIEERIVCVRVASNFIETDYNDCLYVSDIRDKELTTYVKRNKESVTIRKCR